VSADPLVAIDARMAYHTGIGRYIRNLINALLRRDDPLRLLVIVNPNEDPTHVWDWLSVDEQRRPRLELVSFGQTVPPYSLREQAWLPKVLSERRVALLHSPHFNVPLLTSCLQVVTIHDLIYLSHPESAPSGLGRLYASAMLRRAVRRARHVLSPSEATRSELQSRLGLSPERVTVTPHGAEEMAGWVGQVRRGSGDIILPQVRALAGSLLYVGNHLPHKDLPTLLRAFAQLAPMGFGTLKLALAGPTGRGTEALRSEITKLGLEDSVVILGELLDRDLAFLYANSAALVHPSRAEGFGMTTLEAMAAGCPVVASDIPALREVVGDAGLWVSPGDADGLAGALGKLLVSKPQQKSLALKGLQRAQTFSFDRSAALTAEVYCRVLSASS